MNLAPMELSKLFQAASDVISARRVFGEPVQQGGITVIPAATVIGAAGSGGGEGPSEPAVQKHGGGKASAAANVPATGLGGGLGYAMIAWPSGAYEIREGSARWVPALDLNRLAFVAVLLIAMLLRSRRA
jgi:hypothetical protein